MCVGLINNLQKLELYKLVVANLIIKDGLIWYTTKEHDFVAVNAIKINFCNDVGVFHVHFQYEVHRTLHMQEKNSDIRKNEFFTMNHDNSAK